MGFPTFVTDHGCVSFPPNMMIHMVLDWWRRSMISDRGEKICFRSVDSCLYAMSLVDTFLYVEVYADRTGQSSAPLAEFLEGKILLSGRKLHWLLNRNCELICFSIDFLQVFLRKILIKAGIVTVRVLDCEKFKYTDDGNLSITDEK